MEAHAPLEKRDRRASRCCSTNSPIVYRSRAARVHTLRDRSQADLLTKRLYRPACKKVTYRSADASCWIFGGDRSRRFGDLRSPCGAPAVSHYQLLSRLSRTCGAGPASRRALAPGWSGLRARCLPDLASQRVARMDAAAARGARLLYSRLHGEVRQAVRWRRRARHRKGSRLGRPPAPPDALRGRKERPHRSCCVRADRYRSHSPRVEGRDLLRRWYRFRICEAAPRADGPAAGRTHPCGSSAKALAFARPAGT